MCYSCKIMSKHVTGNILSHNSVASAETMNQLLLEQKVTNELLGSLVCQMQAMLRHLELMTESEFED